MRPQRPAPPSQRRHRRHCGPLHRLAAAMLLLGALRPAAEARLDPDAEPAGYSAVQPLGAYKLRTRVATHASPASSPASPTAARKAETAAATTATTMTTTTTTTTTTTAKKMDDRVEPITAKPPEPAADTAGDVADKLMQGKLPVRLGLTRGELKAVFMIVAARLRREGLAVNGNGLSDWDVVLAADASAKNTATYLLTLASEAAAPPRVPIMTLTSKVPIKLPATKAPNCVCMPPGFTLPATGSGQHFQPLEPMQPKAEASTTATEMETEAVAEARTKAPAEEAPTVAVREHARGHLNNLTSINKGLDLIPNLSEALQQHLGTISALIAEVKQQADAKAEEAKAMATARSMAASEAPDQALKSAQRPGVSRASPWPTPGQSQAWTTASAGPVAEPKGAQHPAGTPPRSADANDTRGHPQGVHRNLAVHAPALPATQHPHHQAQHPQQQGSQAQRSPHQMHLPQSQLAQQQHHQHHPQSAASTSPAQQYPYPPHPELVQQPHSQHANAPPPPQFPMPPRPPEVPPPVPVLAAHLSTVPPVVALPPPQFPMPPHPLEVPPMAPMPYPTPSSTALPPQAQQYPGPIPQPPVPELPPMGPMPYPAPPHPITVPPPSEQPQQFAVPHPPVPELPPVQAFPPHSSTAPPPPSQPPKNPAESVHLGPATSDTQRRLLQPPPPQQQPWHLSLPNGQAAQPAGHMVPMYNQGANPLHFAPMYPWGHYMYPVPGLAVLQPQQVQQATAHPPPLRPAMGQMQQLQQQQQQAVEFAPALKALDRGGQAAAPTAVLRMGMIPGLPSMPVFPGLVNMEQKLDELGLGPSKLHVGNIGIDMSLKAPPTFELGRRPPGLQARSAAGGLEEPELPSNETTLFAANVTASSGRTTAALRTSTTAARATAATRAAVRAALAATTTRPVAADAEAGGEEQEADGEQDQSGSSRADGAAEDSTATDSTAGAGSATLRRRPATRSQSDGSDAQDEDPEIEFTVHSYDDEEDEDVERDDEQEDDYGSWERVINGEDTSITEVPYQVALEHNGRLWCGGSIIAKTWIMTAAHCVQGRKRPTPWRVRAGSTNRETGGKLLKVRQVYTHPKYKQLKYDVALFKLADSLTYSNAIQPVKLPAKGMTDPPAGEHMTISGWGRVRPTGFDYPRVLQKATVSIVGRDDCTDQYSNTPFGPISEMEICAGGNRKDTCQGDSGGPMVDSTGTQVGITSWGEGCAQLPGVYANVVNQDLREFVRKVAGV